MNRVEIPLDDISVAAPCHAAWDKMRGSDTVRFCQSCEKNVYNLSDMSRAEAEALIKEKEGSLCVRFARRADGTLITDNCPVGLRGVRRRAKWLRDGAVMAFVWVGAVLTIGVASVRKDGSRPTVAQTVASLRQVQPFKMVIDLIDPPATFTVGAMVYVPPPSATTGMSLNSSGSSPSPLQCEKPGTTQ